MPDWSTLRDAYGPADPVPGLLAQARDDAGVWPELWSRLCHQGTVYDASVAALPDLAQLSAAHEGSDFDDALHLAGAIVASTDHVGTVELDREQHRETLDELATGARRALASAHEDADFVYALQSLTAFESGGAWARELESVVAGELDLTCPECDAEVLLSLGDQPTLSAHDAGVSSAVTPGEPADDVETSLLSATAEHGRVQVAAALRALFGTATCPVCGATVRVADAI